jgi:hypothetical protein
MLFESGVPALARLAGNTTSTKNFLTSTGSGGTANAPSWGTIAAADVPTLNQNTTGTATTALVANALADSGGSVNVSAASAPSANQGLFATSGTTATWQTAPIAGGGTGGTTATIARGNLGVAAGTVITQTLGSPAGTITFSAIPGTYNMLRLVAIGASARVAETDNWNVAVNGGGVYHDMQNLYGLHVSPSAGVGSATTGWATGGGDLPGANATAGVAGILDLQIPAYAGTTLQKIGLWRSGYFDAVASASDGATEQATAAWRSGSAITSLTITTVNSANLVTGTTALLYLS